MDHQSWKEETSEIWPMLDQTDGILSTISAFIAQIIPPAWSYPSKPTYPCILSTGVEQQPDRSTKSELSMFI